jgi:Flp pilus assembly protein TadB
VRALHDWVNRYGGEPFPGEGLPPRLSRRELMERYEAHTRHCRSCAGADRRLKRLQPVSWGLAAIAAVTAAWLGPGLWGALALVIAAAAGFGGLKIQSWLAQLRYGSGRPPRNR